MILTISCATLSGCVYSNVGECPEYSEAAVGQFREYRVGGPTCMAHDQNEFTQETLRRSQFCKDLKD